MKKESPIELRITITPDDKLYKFVSKIKNHLETESPGAILRFILGKASKISFSKFIKLNQKIRNLNQLQSQEASS